MVSELATEDSDLGRARNRNRKPGQESWPTRYILKHRFDSTLIWKGRMTEIG